MSREKETKKAVVDISQQAAFNRTAALDRVGGDEELLREIVGLFLGEYPDLVAQIENAIGSGDAEALQQAAHTLKGSLGTLCAEAGYQRALRLEMMGRGHALGGAREALEELRGHLSRLHQELELVASP